jgi:hypothetical protein
MSLKQVTATELNFVNNKTDLLHFIQYAVKYCCIPDLYHLIGFHENECILHAVNYDVNYNTSIFCIFKVTDSVIVSLNPIKQVNYDSMVI